MPKAWLASHLPIDGCHRTGRLRRTAPPRSFALPVASLHDRFGSICTKLEVSTTESARCSGVWLPPPKYRNKEACNKDTYLDADLYPVLDRRGILYEQPNSTTSLENQG